MTRAEKRRQWRETWDNFKIENFPLLSQFRPIRSTRRLGWRMSYEKFRSK